jgi:hypothetical protein
MDQLLQKRQDLLLPTIARLREELRDADAGLLAARSGADWHSGAIHLAMLGEEFSVRWPEVSTVRASDGSPARPDLQVLLLTYLRNANGSRPTGSWLSFRELPDGGFYHRAFQGYAPDRLAERFGDDLGSFCAAAERIGGRREPMGDASYGFRALPQVWLAAVLWLGDDEFPASARMLFDETSSHYLATDLLATLGRWIVVRMLKAAEMESK